MNEKITVTDAGPIAGTFEVDLSQGPGVYEFQGKRGSGKTTILRMIAGFENPDSGSIIFDGQDIAGVPVNKRPFNTVFQDYALFPNMNVARNIGYGLSIRRVDRREIRERVEKYLDHVDLGYSALEKVNPALIYVSITPFGNDGPYKDFKAADIVTWAMGGPMHRQGDADRAPVRVTHHFQSYLNAGAQAAVGALAALHHRTATGEGQHIDVSMQEAVVWTLMSVIQFWDMMQFNMFRGGAKRRMGGPVARVLFPCKDGYMSFLIGGGQLASISMPPLVKWMAEEGKLGAFENRKDWDAKDWSDKEDHWSKTQEALDAEESTLVNFFADKTKAQLYEQALKRRIILYPASTVKDLAENVQLKEREFYTEVEHPELGESVTYMGAPYKMMGTKWQISKRAPLIGEHNQEVYGEELGFSQEEILRFKEAGVI